MYHKLSFITIILSFFAIQSCQSPLVGEGSIEDKEITIQPFTNLELSGNFRVIIQNGSKNILRIESYPNLIKNLQVNSTQGELIIIQDKVVRDGEICNVFITSQNLEYLKLEDKVVVDQPSSLMGKNLEISLNDQSKLITNVETLNIELTQNDESKCNLKGNCLELELEANDKSELISHFLNVETAIAELNDESLAEINVFKKLSAKAYDNSQLLYIGSPNLEVKTKNAAIIKSKN